MWSALYIEDDDDDAALVSIAFQKARLPVEILRLPDGQAAIKYLACRERAPDLIVLDLKLPVLTGFDVLAWLRKRGQFACIPVIVLSSSELQEDKQRASEMGVFAYVGKAPGFAELVAAVQKVMLVWGAAAGGEPPNSFSW